MYDTVVRYGTWMRNNLGIKAKDVVAMDFENSDTFIFVWLGLWSIGAKPAFINYNLTGKSLSHCVKAANAKICIVDPNVAANVGDDVRADLPDVNFVLLTPELRAQAEATPPVRASDAELAETEFTNLAILIYTSGTTGLPKPAVVSWAKVLACRIFARDDSRPWRQRYYVYRTLSPPFPKALCFSTNRISAVH